MQRGSAPVVGATLLLFIAVVVAVLYFTWVYDYTAAQISKSESVGRKNIECNDAGITILSCDYNYVTGAVTVNIENRGSVDLNGFRVILMYADGTSDYNDNKTLFIESKLTGNAYATANTSKTLSKVRVVPLECDIVSDTTTCG